MKTVTVKMSDAQAARIESIAKMLKIEAGDLMTAMTFGELNGWKDEPQNFIYCLEPVVERYIENREAGGDEVEQFLRAGLKKMSLKKLTQLCIDASNETSAAEQASMKIGALRTAGTLLAVA
jgi:hypothetical protein